jgi:hypothetical protein
LDGAVDHVPAIVGLAQIDDDWRHELPERAVGACVAGEGGRRG